MSWITENPWPLVLILLGTGLVILILGESRGRMIGLLCAAAAAAVYGIEAWLVTPGEQIEQQLQALLQSFIMEDDTMNRIISRTAPELKETARRGLEIARPNPSFHLQDVAVTVADDQNSAEATLRANGSIHLKDGRSVWHAATRWRTRWIREDDTWKLAEVHRLNPVTGEEIGILASE